MNPLKPSYCIPLLLFIATSCYQPVENTGAKDAVEAENSSSDSNKTTQKIQPASWDTVAVGDLNFDMVVDTAFVYTPPTIVHLNERGEETYADQLADSLSYNRVRFSCAWPEVEFQRSVWGQIANVGDLDNDGKCELLFRPGWFWSCWGRVYLCSLKKGQWKIPIEVTAYVCTDEPLQSRLVKKGKKYYVVGEKLEDGEQLSYEVAVKL